VNCFALAGIECIRRLAAPLLQAALDTVWSAGAVRAARARRR
jgi:hypothetical protein